MERVFTEVRRYNPAGSFPTLVIDGPKRAIVGFREEQLREKERNQANLAMIKEMKTKADDAFKNQHYREAAQYYASIAMADVDVPSNEIEIEVQAEVAPVVTVPRVRPNYYETENLSMTIEATGGNLLYQWCKGSTDNADLTGQEVLLPRCQSRHTCWGRLEAS
jgi:hypothetical protein